MSKTKTIIAVVAILILIQFFQIDKSTSQLDPSRDFISLTQPEAEISTIFKSTCYDCHSNQTKYPWYSNVAPLNWWVKHHVDEGLEHLNFSAWSDYSPEDQDHKLEEIYEEVEAGEMPLSSYTWAHAEARLTSEQREKLILWVKSLRN